MLILANLLLIVGVTFIMYYRSLNYEFIIDDHNHVKTAQMRDAILIKAPEDKKAEIAKEFEVTKNFWKRIWEHFYGIKFTNMPVAHLFNILVHTAVCCLIYLVFGRDNVSLLAALLFSLNPVNNQCSIWLSGRPYATSTMLFLIGMLWLPLMPVMYGLANWWTINTLFAPILMLFIEPWWLALIMPLGLIVIKAKAKNSFEAGQKRYSGASNVMREISFRKLIIVFKTVGYYFYLCLFPFNLGMCHSYMATFGLSDADNKKWLKIDRFFFLGIVVCLTALFSLFYKVYAPLFGILWFVIFTAQWSNFIVISHLITERYIYLANIGLMYLLANVIIGTPLMWIFLTFYAVRLFFFLPVYKTIVTYWESNTRTFPCASMGWNQYGLGMLQYGNGGTALDAWIRGVQERPNDFSLNFNLANILLGSGLPRESARFIKKAEENLDPNNNYEFWTKEIEKIKGGLKSAGVQV